MVTQFEFALHPVGPEVMVMLPVYRAEDAVSVMKAWRDYMTTAPDEIGGTAEEQAAGWRLLFDGASTGAYVTPKAAHMLTHFAPNAPPFTTTARSPGVTSPTSSPPVPCSLGRWRTEKALRGLPFK